MSTDYSQQKSRLQKKIQIAKKFQIRKMCNQLFFFELKLHQFKKNANIGGSSDGSIFIPSDDPSILRFIDTACNLHEICPRL